MRTGRRVAVLCSVLTAALGFAASAHADVDTTPPELHALALSPAAVDVSQPGAQLVAHATITDDISGVSAIDTIGLPSCILSGAPSPGASAISVRGPSGAFATGAFRHLSGDEYEARIAFSLFAASGTWTINFVALGDCAGNVIGFTGNQLADRGFATTFEIVNAQSDTAPPSMSSLSLEPSSVDASQPGAQLVARATIADDVSGVSAIDTNGLPSCISSGGPPPSATTIGVRGPGTGGFAGAAFKRIAGDEYEARLTFSHFAAPGTWSINFVALMDCAGNSIGLNASQLAALGFPTTFEVTNPNADSTPPELHALSFATPTVPAPGEVVVRATISDDVSGVSAIDVSGLPSCIAAGGPPGSSSGLSIRAESAPTFGFGSFRRTGGNEYEARIPISPFAPLGPWKINFVAVVDCAGNSLGLSTDQLAQRGFPTTFVVGQVDTTAPVIVPRVEGPQGANGWYVGDVSVRWEVTDGESPVTSRSGCEDGVVADDAGGVTFQCEATSAGGTARESVTIKRDATEPSVDVLFSRDPDGFPTWFNHSFGYFPLGHDETSGIASCDPGVGYDGPDAAFVSVTRSCSDGAGNVGSGHAGFRFDATAPLVSCVPTPATLWPPNEKLVPVFIAVLVTDRLSGPAGFALNGVTSNEPLSAEDVTEFAVGTADADGFLRAKRLGNAGDREYTLSYTGSDVAGNSARCAARVTVPHDEGQ